MEKRINEELRQYKLFRIQEVESKLRRFKITYVEIKEHVAVRLSKNITSNIVRVILSLLAILFLSIGIMCFFPEKLIVLLKPGGLYLSVTEQKETILMSDFCKYLFISISFLLFFTSYLLRANIQKRNNVYSLSVLLKEVMDYMESSANGDKRKYEYFVDSLAEQEKIKRNAV